MVIGITGTDGSGKGTVGEYLVTHKGFTHYSAREFIVAEIERQGLPIDRNQMRLTANELRATYGNEFVVRQAYEKAAAEEKQNVVIESVRTTAEADYLKSHGGLLLAVDASPEVRYHDSVEFKALPKAPEGMEVAHVDVVIRVRKAQG